MILPLPKKAVADCKAFLKDVSGKSDINWPRFGRILALLVADLLERRGND
jgi:hypothetical protein